MRFITLFFLTISLAACTSNPPAPVIDRLPSNRLPENQTKKTEASPTLKKTIANRPTYKAGDWRPDTYIVKKGDNLFSIGLEYGYDYKDIAQANNIAAPYPIQTGQLLKLKSLKEKVAVVENKQNGNSNQVGNNTNNTDSVKITPINAETSTTSAAPSVATTAIITISEPKATRELYSEEALKKPSPTPAVKPIVAIITEASSKPSESKLGDDTKPAAKPEAKPSAESPEDMDWAWPTKGKVLANFNEVSNKGIDIAGSTGQAVNAAATGKVIYTGSDLRGYGKLVIIKHNATYLSVYAHNSQILVTEGQQITRGQKIAEMGNTDSNTIKLHFEIRRQGKSVDPSKYLAAN